MKLILLLSTLLVISHATSYPELENEEWKFFKIQHDKRYSSFHEEHYRHQIYLENRKRIEEHNERFARAEISYRLAMNRYGDLSHHEFVAMFNLVNRSQSISERRGVPSSSSSSIQTPDAADWRAKGAVTTVKNQGPCGATWFSSAGSIEGQLAIKTGKLVPVSEQNLMDCSNPDGFHGCQGGWLEDGFKYVKDNGGIDTEEYYPYEGRDGPCRYDPRYSAGTINGYVNIQTGNEVQLKNAVGNIGPVSVAFDATHSSFQFYTSGIYYEKDCSSSVLAHAALVVGYGKETDGDYWLVKNSWGTDWGDGGYFKIARNRNNHCGIASWAIYPTV